MSSVKFEANFEKCYLIILSKLTNLLFHRKSRSIEYKCYKEFFEFDVKLLKYIKTFWDEIFYKADERLRKHQKICLLTVRMSEIFTKKHLLFISLLTDNRICAVRNCGFRNTFTRDWIIVGHWFLQKYTKSKHIFFIFWPSCRNQLDFRSLRYHPQESRHSFTSSKKKVYRNLNSSRFWGNVLWYCLGCWIFLN